MVLRSVYFMVKFLILIPDFIHHIVHDFKAMFRMLCCKLRTPLPIHFKLPIVIGIDSLMVCLLFGEISIFHSRVMGLYSINCRRFFVCRAVNWEPLGQFTSNFAWWIKSHNSGMKILNFTIKYTDHKTINSNNYAKFEVNWPRGSQFTARHTKNRLQFIE
jgi:hypothetical protein